MERKPLTADRWRQIETIFHQAVAVEQTERLAMVGRLCDHDKDLRAEVELMVRASSRESCGESRGRNQPSIWLVAE